jgi:hypothetical protein
MYLFGFFGDKVYVAEADFELKILLSQHLVCWDYVRAPPHLAPVTILFIFLWFWGLNSEPTP